jgi:hypothetical protein
MITLYTERVLINEYIDAINSKMPYMESDDLRRAKRTLRYLRKQLASIGKSWQVGPVW